MSSDLKIYVAGPYTNRSRSQRIANVYAAIDAGYELMEAGYVAFIPHMSHFIEEHALLTGKSANATYDFWLRQDFAWLDECQGVLKLAPSHGADLEEKRAQERGIPVWYSLEEALTALKEMEAVGVA